MKTAQKNNRALETIQERLLKNKETRGIRYSLEPIIDASTKLNSPHLNLPFSIHIAGTNGKGSVLHYLKAAFMKQSLKVGHYTSPHIHNYTERIAINDIPISIEEFKTLYEDIDARTKDYPLTEFELLTLLAFVYFREKKPDLILIETGLGGRLDASNILPSNLSVITHIGYDHQDILGNTLKEITQEKAGIIKANQKTFTLQHQNPLITQIIQKQALKQKTTLYLSTSPPSNSMIPKYQLENMALAFEVFKHSPFYALRSNLLKSQDSFINDVSSKKPWGRFEIIKNKTQTLIIDGAHNLTAFQALCDALRTQFPNKNVSFLIGLNHKRNTQDISPLLELCYQNLYYCEFDNEQAMSYSTFKQDVLNTQAYYLGSPLPKDPLLVITGSLYFISYFKALNKHP